MEILRILSRFWRWYKNLYIGKSWWKKALVALTTLIVLLIFYIFALLTNLLWLFGKSPSLTDIMHPKNAEASEIYSADGKLLGRYFNENRSPVKYDSINPVFWEALISTEDERFYSHHGIDFAGIGAAAKDALSGHARGASTITQQLVKNMFRVRTQYSTGLLGKIPGLRILIMKSKEMVLAVGIELFNDKQDILEMYANTVDFGSNAYGIKTAAKTYFNTTPARLKAEEAAVLVGLLKATSAYNPKINPKNSLKRRNVVLDNMRAHKYLTQAECDSLQSLPIRLDFQTLTAYDGLALYFRDAVADNLEKILPDVDPYTDGLKIYTTLDSRMQKYAEEAVREQMKIVQRNFNSHWAGMGEPWRDEKGNVIPRFIEGIAEKTDTYKKLKAKYQDKTDSINYYLNKPHRVELFDYEQGKIVKEMSTMDSIRYMVAFMHTGFVAMEPRSGAVKAYVGDVDFSTWKYDKVRAMRQPGSTFKLFVYATAMKQGRVPSDRIRDEYIRMEVYDKKKDTTTIWQPHNANGRFTNMEMPLRQAFAQSVNTVAVKLGQEVGIPSVIQTAHDMGIHSPLDDQPSLPLGSSDVNLLELVDGYATIANEGVQVEPHFITKVLDREGEIIYLAKHEERRVLSPEAAFYMQKLLEAGTRDAGGTSQSLLAMEYMGGFNGKIDVGGKTGTSNNHSDAWFIGVTPNLVGGAWVGGEYRSIHFRTGALGQGSKTALPIFGKFMYKVLRDPQLAPTYLQRYGLPPTDIEPAAYEAAYVGTVDTTYSHVNDSAQYVPIDVMGTQEENGENAEVEMGEPSMDHIRVQAPQSPRPAQRQENNRHPQNVDNLFQ